MMAQLKAAAQKPSASSALEGIGAPTLSQKPQAAGRVDFAEVLKSSINQVNPIPGQRRSAGEKALQWEMTRSACQT